MNASCAGRILRLLAVTIVLAGAGPAIAPSIAQDRGLPVRAQIGRISLVVSDIEKSLAFYEGIGLTKTSDRVTSDTDQGGVFGAADLPLTADSKRARVAVLGSGGQSLALVWYDRPALPSARGNLMGLGTGDVLVSVLVADLQGAYRQLNELGMRFHLPPTRFTGMSADGATQSGQRFLAYDPDGHLVEVSQIDTRR